MTAPERIMRPTSSAATCQTFAACTTTEVTARSEFVNVTSAMRKGRRRKNRWTSGARLRRRISAGGGARVRGGRAEAWHAGGEGERSARVRGAAGASARVVVGDQLGEEVERLAAEEVHGHPGAGGERDDEVREELPHRAKPLDREVE